MRNHVKLISIASIVMATLVMASLQTRSQAAPPSFKQYTIEEFLGTTNYRGASFSPDKSKILVSSDGTGIYNAYAIPIRGGRSKQLTKSIEDAVMVTSYFPNDERFLYSGDRGGNELHHVFVRELDGSVKDLTPGDGFKAASYGWAQDDASFLIGTTERDQRYFDVYEYDVKTYERKLLYKNEKGYDFSAISPDKRFVALSKTVTNADSDIYLYDRRTGESKLLTDDKAEVQNTPQDFSPDGKYLYYLTNKGSEFDYLVRYELAGGKVDEVVKTNWDVWYANFSKKGKYLVVGINNDSRTELRIYEAKTMQAVTLPELSDADISSVSISRDEQTMAFYATSAKMPSDLFVHSLTGGKPQQLTQSLNPKIAPEHLVEAGWPGSNPTTASKSPAFSIGPIRRAKETRRRPSFGSTAAPAGSRASATVP